MALSPLHFDLVQSKSQTCCKSLPKGTHGTYRKSALFFLEKNFWPSRSELSRFASVSTPPKVTQSPGSSIASRFGQVKSDAKLVVLKKKAGPSMQELPHTATMAGGVELEQQRTGAALDDAAILQRQAAVLDKVMATCASSRGSHKANTPANIAANVSANPGFGLGSRGSQQGENHHKGGSQAGSQPRETGSPSPSKDAPPPQSPLIIPSDEGRSEGDPSFTMESEDQDSGDSSDESEGGKEPLFPHPPVPGESHRSGASHRVPRDPEPGDRTGPLYQFDQGSFSPVKSEEVSRESQRSQQGEASSEVDLSLQPGQVPRPDATQSTQQELNHPTSPVFHLDLGEDPKVSPPRVDSQQAGKSCDTQDPPPSFW